MKVTIDWLKKNYDYFNQKYFKGELPNIPLNINSRFSKTWGRAYYKCKYNPVSNGIEVYDLKIEITGKHDIPEKWLQNTLLHEMVHILDYYKHIDHYYTLHGKELIKKSYDAHGSWFLHFGETVLAKDGWIITKYVTQQEIEESSSKEPYYMVVVHNEYNLFRKENNYQAVKAKGTKKEYFIFKTNKMNLKTAISEMAKYKHVNAYYKKEMISVDCYPSYEIYETSHGRYSMTKSCAKRISGWYYDENEIKEVLTEINAKKI